MVQADLHIQMEDSFTFLQTCDDWWLQVHNPVEPFNI